MYDVILRQGSNEIVLNFDFSDDAGEIIGEILEHSKNVTATVIKREDVAKNGRR